MSVTVSRTADYDDEVIADGFKHKLVVRAGQVLIFEKGSRFPVQYGDYGSTRGSREDALAHFRALERPYFEEE
jgi:hypothetical protein